jgi:hypothetical protein
MNISWSTNTLYYGDMNLIQSGDFYPNNYLTNWLTDWLTDSTEQSPSWEPNNNPASRQLPHLL